MTLSDYYNDYEGLTKDRRMQARKTFLEKLSVHNHWSLIDEFMAIAIEHENDDAFGTEGMDV